jgi:hypothetical protein
MTPVSIFSSRVAKSAVFPQRKPVTVQAKRSTKSACVGAPPLAVESCGDCSSALQAQRLLRDAGGDEPGDIADFITGHHRGHRRKDRRHRGMAG